MDVSGAPRVPAGINGGELHAAVGARQLRAAQEDLPAGVEPAELALEAGVHAGRVALPDVHRGVGEGRAAVGAQHQQIELQRRALPIFPQVGAQHVAVHVVGAFGLLRIQRAGAGGIGRSGLDDFAGIARAGGLLRGLFVFGLQRVGIGRRVFVFLVGLHVLRIAVRNRSASTSASAFVSLLPKWRSSEKR